MDLLLAILAGIGGTGALISAGLVLLPEKKVRRAGRSLGRFIDRWLKVKFGQKVGEKLGDETVFAFCIGVAEGMDELEVHPAEQGEPHESDGS